MRVAESPDYLQSVIDHPQVFRWIAPDGVDTLPLAAVFADGIGLEFDTGGFFFHRLGDGVYEVHTLFLPGTKGALDCCKAAAHFMFCATDCNRIVTKVPEDNVPAWKLTEKMNFRQDYVQPDKFLRDGTLHDVRHYSLVMDDWARTQESAIWVKSQCIDLGQAAKALRFIYRWAVANDEYHLMEGQGCLSLARLSEA